MEIEVEIKVLPKGIDRLVESANMADEHVKMLCDFFDKMKNCANCGSFHVLNQKTFLCVPTGKQAYPVECCEKWRMKNGS